MYIIDKNQDYYDHYSHVYGIDKNITFDRRGSVLLDDERILFIAKYYKYHSIPDSYNMLLEIGYSQYLIEISHIIRTDKNLKSCQMKLLRTFRDNKHYFESTISIREVFLRHFCRWETKDYDAKYEQYIQTVPFSDLISTILENKINLPILANTQITSLIDGEEIWKEVSMYISSLKTEKDQETAGLTDVDKAINHGFDKKTSFRHPIK